MPREVTVFSGDAQPLRLTELDRRFFAMLDRHSTPLPAPEGDGDACELEIVRRFNQAMSQKRFRIGDA